MDAFKVQLMELQHEQLRVLNALCEKNDIAPSVKA
jgi:hypothetical protein